MDNKLIKILLVEDNPEDARLIQEMLTDVQGFSFDMACADELSIGLERLAKEGIDVVLLDLSLSDSQGLDTFDMVNAHVPWMPIVIMTGLTDEALAVEAVKRGAQDYLVKGQVDGTSLVRSIRCALARNAELRTLSLTDELTGLNNRRGFLTLAQQQIRLAKRTERIAVLLFVDLDGMKWINDTLGHKEGDRALKKTADILKKTFRESDIVARIGGDEFAILLLVKTSMDCKEIILTRLQERLESYNSQVNINHKYKLSLSLGIASYDAEHPCSIEELMGQADALMYEHKRSKRNP